MKTEAGSTHAAAATAPEVMTRLIGETVSAGDMARRNTCPRCPCPVGFRHADATGATPGRARSKAESAKSGQRRRTGDPLRGRQFVACAHTAATIVMCVMCLLLAAAGACQRGANSRPVRTVSSDDGFIAVVGAGEDNPLWPVLRGSAQRANRDLGSITVRIVAPQIGSPAAQTELIRSLRGQQLRAICVQVTDADAIAPVLEELRTAGVLVVTMIQPVASRLPFHHCGIDEAQVGKAIAEALTEGIDDKGTVAVLRGDEADKELTARYRGFHNELKHHTDVRVLRELRYPGDPERARKTIRDFCERFPRLNGFAVLGAWPLQSPEGLSEPLVPAGCKLVSVDPLPGTWPLLARGWCHALVGAEYARIADKAIQWCVVVLAESELPPQTYSVPARKVWSGNLESWKLQWRQWTEVPS